MSTDTSAPDTTEDRAHAVIDHMHNLHRTGLANAIHSQASRLRTLAEQLDRHAATIARVPYSGAPDYASVVTDAQHDILCALANLSIDGLTRKAADADALCRQGGAAQVGSGS